MSKFVLTDEMKNRMRRALQMSGWVVEVEGRSYVRGSLEIDLQSNQIRFIAADGTPVAQIDVDRRLDPEDTITIKDVWVLTELNIT